VRRMARGLSFGPVLLCAAAAVGREMPLGNVFLTTDELVLPVRADGPVRFAIRDLWGGVVAEGAAEPKGDLALIRPPAGRLGYFTLELDGKTLTSFAVITPVDIAKMPDNPFGVMCHFAQGWDVDVMPLIAKAGIGSFRDEHYWAHVEQRRGEYIFPERSDRYMKEAARLGLDPLIVMSFGNKLYDHEDGPSTPEGYLGYARYGEAILRRYAGQVRWLEVWNEYNGTWCPPAARADRPRYYAEMIKHVHGYLKPRYPDVKLLGCACVHVPIPYLEGVFRRGGLDYMDAVVIHPYRDVPEGVELELRELRELIRKHNGGREKPVWATEFGAMAGLGRERASYLARMCVLLLSEKVERMYWYLMRNYQDFPDMGLVEKPEHPWGRYAVKPPYVAYANLIRQLYGAEYVGREAYRKYTRAYVFLFRRAREEIRACWGTEPVDIELVTSKPLAVVDMMGNESTLVPRGGRARLELGLDPVFVRGAVRSIAEVVAGPEVIADSAEDFDAREQGKASWYYGHYDGDGQGQGDGAEPSGPYTDDDFEPMAPSHDDWGYFWQGPGETWFRLGRGGGHAGAGGPRGAWPVRRWKSQVAGKIKIALSVGCGNQGDGIEAKVLVDGREVFSRRAGGRSPTKVRSDLEVDVRQGALVDFAATPGPDRNNSYDSFDYHVRIYLLRSDTAAPAPRRAGAE